jgi:CheY-like chemotaxis protein
VILVRDTGKGISAELLPHIFELFLQGEGDLDRRQGGLGIGLNVVKRLIDLHGGQVEVRSDGIGRGSEFTVRLPLSLTLPAGNQITAVVEEKPRTGKTPWRILVVDDHVDFAESMAVLLECEGHEARLALDGPTALKLALEFQPEVILLDLGLPGMDGYAVARELRARPETHDMVFIAVTGHGRPEDRVYTQAAGFDYHLVKPIAWEELNRLLTSCQSKSSTSTGTP